DGARQGTAQLPPPREKFGLVRRRQEEGELVTAEARQVDAVGSADGFHAPTDLLEKPVADPVAIGVVDRLEAIEIEDTDGQTPAFGVCPVGFFQSGEERAAVRQVRQAIDVGEAKILVAERDGLRPCLHHVREVIVVDVQDHEHRERHQDDVDRRGDEGGLARADEEADEEPVDDHRDDQGGRSQMHQAENAADDRDGHVECHMGLGIGGAIAGQRERPSRKDQRDDDRELQRPQQFGPDAVRRRLSVTLPPPHRDPQDTHHGHQAGNAHREPHRRVIDVGGRQRPCIGHENDVHERHLARECAVLGSQKIGIVGQRPEAEELRGQAPEAAGRGLLYVHHVPLLGRCPSGSSSERLAVRHRRRATERLPGYPKNHFPNEG
ncbi:hypothetical protein VF08_38155, partial [Nostoc linckia z8]